MKTNSLSDTTKLNNGIKMPLLGFGTWKMSEGEETVKAIRYALEVGYRLIDTATLYGNEVSVGEAVRASAIPRKEIFVTTKLWPTDFFNPEQAFQGSLDRLQFDYVDLYLIHWPIPLMPKSVWRSLENIYEQKLARAIGISNYGIGDIEKLLEYARVRPAINQIKFSPFDYAEEIMKCCREHKIALEAYSPLTRGAYLNDATIRRIAEKYGKKPAQIMIRWCIEKDAITIPKSSNPVHIRENADVFDFSLDVEDMQALDSLS